MDGFLLFFFILNRIYGAASQPNSLQNDSAARLWPMIPRMGLRIYLFYWRRIDCDFKKSRWIFDDLPKEKKNGVPLAICSSQFSKTTGLKNPFKMVLIHTKHISIPTDTWFSDFFCVRNVCVCTLSRLHVAEKNNNKHIYFWLQCEKLYSRSFWNMIDDSDFSCFASH